MSSSGDPDHSRETRQVQHTVTGLRASTPHSPELRTPFWAPHEAYLESFSVANYWELRLPSPDPTESLSMPFQRPPAEGGTQSRAHRAVAVSTSLAALQQNQPSQKPPAAASDLAAALGIIKSLLNSFTRGNKNLRTGTKPLNLSSQFSKYF